jgi:hypothetical protein
MAISVVVVSLGLVPLEVPLPLLLYQGGEVTRKVTKLVVT